MYQDLSMHHDQPVKKKQSRCTNLFKGKCEILFWKFVESFGAGPEQGSQHCLADIASPDR